MQFQQSVVVTDMVTLWCCGSVCVCVCVCVCEDVGTQFNNTLNCRSDIIWQTNTRRFFIMTSVADPDPGPDLYHLFKTKIKRKKI